MKQSSDRLRQTVVVVSAILAIVGSFIGSGAAGGTPIQNASGGALAADATPIAPDGPVGLYLGWVSIATAANVTAMLVAAGFGGFGISADVWAVGVIAVAGLVGVLIARSARGRLAPSSSLCWGLAWVAVAGLTGTLLSTPGAIAALVAVVVILTVTITIRIGSSSPASTRGLVPA